MIDQTITDQLNGVRKLREWLNLETVSHMIEGTGADTGGVNALPHGKMTWEPGAIGRFAFTGAVRKPGQTWDDCYTYGELSTGPLTAIYFSLQMEFAFPAATLANKRPFEFELEYCESGLAYNMAWQYKMNHDDGGPGWRMFNKKTQEWEFFAGLPPISPQADKFTAMRAHFLIDRSHQSCIHDSLEVDGKFYTVGTAHAAVRKATPANYLHNAFQHDSDGRGTPLVALLRNVHVRCL